VAADWFDRLTGHFTLVVSNPPYIASHEIERLAPEVARHDPKTALDGGLDGLDAYRRIAASVRRFLRPGGALVVEIGSKQVQAVSDIFRDEGLVVSDDAVREDLAGLPRCISAKLPAKTQGSSAQRSKNMLGIS
jgi:release factor glutamine methyltransferase